MMFDSPGQHIKQACCQDNKADQQNDPGHTACFTLFSEWHGAVHASFLKLARRQLHNLDTARPPGQCRSPEGEGFVQTRGAAGLPLSFPDGSEILAEKSTENDEDQF